MSNSNLTVSGTLTASLPSATSSVLGGVMVQSGSGISVDSSGNISLTNPTATGTLLNVQRLTTSGTYTPTTGTNSVIIYMIGGGGGGGGAPSTTSSESAAGGNGASGAWAIFRLTSGFSGVTVTIGSGGSSGYSGNIGSRGSSTSFGTYTVGGGLGGGYAGPISSSSLLISDQSGWGGSTPPTNNVIGSSVIISAGLGSPGQEILILGLNGNNIASTHGGDSMFGTGGFVATPYGSATSPTANSGCGGGGSVAYNSASSGLSGSNGADGVCIIYEYS